MNADFHRPPGPLEKGFAVIALLFFADAFISLIAQKSGMKIVLGASDRLVMVISYSIYMLTAFLIISRVKDVFVLLVKEKFLLCLVCVAVLSAFWSDAPSITLRRCIGLGGTTLFGLYLAVRYTLSEQLRLLASMLRIAIIFSLLFGMLLPDYGIATEIHEGAWHGIFDTKNVLGRLMALSAIVFTLLVVDKTKYRRVQWAFLIASLGLLILSTSRTSLILLSAFFVFLFVYHSLNWHFYLRLFLYCILIAAVIIALICVANISWVVPPPTEAEMTLTGRTDLWEAVWVMIRKHPVLGYGYAAFWREIEGQSKYVWQMIGWQTPHSHNGLLDLCLDLGLVGVMMFLSGFFQAIRNFIHRKGSVNRVEFLWPLVYLTFFMASNLLESALVRNNSIFFVLYVSTICSFYVVSHSLSQETSCK